MDYTEIIENMNKIFTDTDVIMEKIRVIPNKVDKLKQDGDFNDIEDIGILVDNCLDGIATLSAATSNNFALMNSLFELVKSKMS